MRIRKDIPFGNLCSYSINTEKSPPVVEFAADPHGGPESLWFCFRLEKTTADESKRVRLVFKFFQNVLGGGTHGNLSIVCRTENDEWGRLGPGIPETAPDGQLSLVWNVDFIYEYMDFALCYPYGENELAGLVKKSHGYWKSDSIGVSQGGRDITRLSNSIGGNVDGRKPGIYVVSRQHSGETPGSWALHGFLDYFAESGNRNFVIWGVPLSNIDGVVNGDYGKDNFPYDLNRAWGNPPMRHETNIIMTDMRRWAERCNALISFDFHAPGAVENDGIYAFLPQDQQGNFASDSLKLGEILNNSLKPTGFVSSEFIRSANYKSRWETPGFTRFSLDVMKLMTFSFEFPYSFAGNKEPTREDYMRAGAVIAETVDGSVQYK